MELTFFSENKQTIQVEISLNDKTSESKDWIYNQEFNIPGSTGNSEKQTWDLKLLYELHVNWIKTKNPTCTPQLLRIKQKPRYLDKTGIHALASIGGKEL